MRPATNSRKRVRASQSPLRRQFTEPIIAPAIILIVRIGEPDCATVCISRTHVSQRGSSLIVCLHRGLRTPDRQSIAHGFWYAQVLHGSPSWHPMSIRALLPRALIGQPLLAEIFEFPAKAYTYRTLANGLDETHEAQLCGSAPENDVAKWTEAHLLDLRSLGKLIVKSSDRVSSHHLSIFSRHNREPSGCHCSRQKWHGASPRSIIQEASCPEQKRCRNCAPA